LQSPLKSFLAGERQFHRAEWTRAEVIAALKEHEGLAQLQNHAAIYGDAAKGGRPRKHPKAPLKKQPDDGQQVSDKEMGGIKEAAIDVRKMMDSFCDHYGKP